MNNSYDVVEIDLLQIWQIIKKYFFIFVLICLVCSAIGFSVAKYVLPEKFEATSKIIIVKDETDASNSVTYNDIQLSQKLASTYKQVILSEAVSDKVISKLDLENKYQIGTKEYGKIVEVVPQDNTEVMAITVETKDPKLSADIANEIVDVFIDKIYEIYDVKNVSILNKAKVPTVKSYPSLSKYTAIGGVIGLVICAIITMIKLFTDTKVKTEEEVKAIFDYPIIGTIPEFVIKEENGDDSTI